MGIDVFTYLNWGQTGQLPTHHPDIRRRKRHVQLGGVLGQPAVADGDVAEPLDR